MVVHVLQLFLSREVAIYQVRMEAAQTKYEDAELFEIKREAKSDQRRKGRSEKLTKTAMKAPTMETQYLEKTSKKTSPPDKSSLPGSFATSS